jgi:hypothetical protein
MWYDAILWFLIVGNQLAVNHDYDYNTNTFRPKVVERKQFDSSNRAGTAQVESDRPKLYRAPTFYKY